MNRCFLAENACLNPRVETTQTLGCQFKSCFFLKLHKNLYFHLLILFYYVNIAQGSALHKSGNLFQRAIFYFFQSLYFF